MSREKEDFWDNKERVIAAFPNREWIDAKDVAQWLGNGVTPRGLYERKDTPFKKRCGKWVTTVTALARWLS